MKKRRVTVEGFEGSIEELAKRVCRLDYEKLQDFFEACGDELNRQACVHARGKRMKTANQLQKAAHKMLDVCLTVFRASRASVAGK